jgi:cytidylate kinase
MIVTIDGPAGAGKSSVAQELARRLGFRFLDTGAMYRAVALAGMRRSVDWQVPDQLAEVAEQVDIQLSGSKILLDGEDVSSEIRTSEVTGVTRYAAANPRIRSRLVELQRATVSAGSVSETGVVAEGRDQGTVAFPGAECKIFLTATPGERARRRLLDLQSQGEDSTLEDVLAAQDKRDESDSKRAVGPLVAAEDAVEVCSDGMTFEQVVDRLESIVRSRYDDR